MMKKYILKLSTNIMELITSVQGNNNELDVILCKFTAVKELHQDIEKYFLTQTGNGRKNLKFLKQDTRWSNDVLKLQELIIEYQTELNTKHFVLSCIAFHRIAQKVILKYEKYKKEKNYFSYDDLIYHTYKLFNNAEIKDWVLYKLDSKIDHILVDEAQDTSILQWKIIDCLIEDFFASDTGKKSIFIVGDSKQSVYSFQGANLYYFHDYLDALKKKFQLYDKKHKVVNLEQNFRSNTTIVNFIKGFFQHLNINIFSHNITSSISKRGDLNGGVEIWEYEKVELTNTSDFTIQEISNYSTKLDPRFHGDDNERQGDNNERQASRCHSRGGGNLYSRIEIDPRKNNVGHGNDNEQQGDNNERQASRCHSRGGGNLYSRIEIDPRKEQRRARE